MEVAIHPGHLEQSECQQIMSVACARDEPFKTFKGNFGEFLAESKHTEHFCGFRELIGLSRVIQEQGSIDGWHRVISAYARPADSSVPVNGDLLEIDLQQTHDVDRSVQ